MLLPCVGHSLPLAPFYSSLTFHVPALKLQLNKKNLSFAPALSSCRCQSSYNVTPIPPSPSVSLCRTAWPGVPNSSLPSSCSVPWFQKFGLLT